MEGWGRGSVVLPYDLQILYLPGRPLDSMGEQVSKNDTSSTNRWRSLDMNRFYMRVDDHKHKSDMESAAPAHSGLSSRGFCVFIYSSTAEYRPSTIRRFNV
ncbi:hypothetical protein NDU88_007946 [Pleurodeles waltl]|uniref:Uncharacterized protein n=1 Tax=Pleurodeles waltl TaxID=8319 RepID=A0AAV7QT51_PLEWA|nr:hypothetical protein NDU88_007946 [Pleurodeles waltl]